jgi:hypothetical protein
LDTCDFVARNNGEENMREAIKLYLTPEQAAEVARRAEAAGIGRSPWIARLIERETGLPCLDSRPGLHRLTRDERAAAGKKGLESRWGNGKKAAKTRRRKK